MVAVIIVPQTVNVFPYVHLMNTPHSSLHSVEIVLIPVLLVAAERKTAISAMTSTVKLVQDGMTDYVQIVPTLPQVPTIVLALQTSMVISSTA
jgi:hypothetical protein